DHRRARGRVQQQALEGGGGLGICQHEGVVDQEHALAGDLRRQAGGPGDAKPVHGQAGTVGGPVGRQHGLARTGGRADEQHPAVAATAVLREHRGIDSVEQQRSGDRRERGLGRPREPGSTGVVRSAHSALPFRCFRAIPAVLPRREKTRSTTTRAQKAEFTGPMRVSRSCPLFLLFKFHRYRPAASVSPISFRSEELPDVLSPVAVCSSYAAALSVLSRRLAVYAVSLVESAVSWFAPAVSSRRRCRLVGCAGGVVSSAVPALLLFAPEPVERGQVRDEVPTFVPSGG